MDAMQLNAFSTAREQIVERRHKLESAITTIGPRTELTSLLAEVDAALERLSVGSYGLCETCHDPIESDRLIADPLARFCLDHLSPPEQRALEQDLQLAARVQQGLLPDLSRMTGPWEVAYAYRPARIVSGDYLDLVSIDGDLYFMLGDVSGKGVAAATVMPQLHAMFRALLPAGLPLCDLIARASRLFCETTLPTHYATLVCGRARPDGEIELCNAGHVPPLVARLTGVTPLPPGGMPIGMFCNQQFESQRVRLDPGEMLILSTDGVTEAEEPQGEQFGVERLGNAVQRLATAAPQGLIEGCLRAVEAWRASATLNDDVTLMVIRRAARPL
jgi:phosphoserine phosphatase RsbU/P